MGCPIKLNKGLLKSLIGSTNCNQALSILYWLGQIVDEKKKIEAGTSLATETINERSNSEASNPNNKEAGEQSFSFAPTEDYI